MESLDIDQVKAIVESALREDIGEGDITTSALVSVDQDARAEILVCEPCRLAGLIVSELVFKSLDHRVEFVSLEKEGSDVPPGPVAEVTGPAWAILTGERTALNFLQRLSGIATQTARFVAKSKLYGIAVMDTRKTTPTLRMLERYAVRVGGGENHRYDLSAMILIKENHCAIQRRFGPGAMARSIHLAREHCSGREVEVEVETLEEVGEALEAGADILMLDNFEVADLEKAVKLVEGRAVLEASGGVTLDSIERVAATGVDRVSIGSLTHSSKSIDFNLELT